VGSNDLFDSFNRSFTNIRPDVVLGPPASGKCFLIKNYYDGNALESIIGLTNLEPVKACGEHVIGESKPGPPASGEQWKKVVEFLTKLFPRIRALTNVMPTRKALDELKRHGFNDDELDLIEKYLSDTNTVPKQLIDHLIDLKSKGKYDTLMLYRIPWDIDTNGLDDSVKEAIGLIRNYFNKGIKWLGIKYIPPGLVAEVVNVIRSKGLNEAMEYVKGQAEAYYRAVKLLVGKEDAEFEGLLATSILNLIDQLTVGGLKSAINTLLTGAISLSVSAVATAIVLSLLHKSTEGSEGGIINELIEVRQHWSGLHPSLKRLIASKVAMQLGVTPKEVEDSLDQLFRFNDEEFKQLIDSIQEKLRELEEAVRKLEKNVDLLSSEIKGFKIYKLRDITNGLLYSNIRLMGNDLGVVSQFYEKLEVNVVRSGKFNEYLNQVKERSKNGPVVLIGPRGVGKSVLTANAIWELLREGDFYGVIKIEELANDAERLRLENFLRMYTNEFAKDLGRLIVLYDPSSAEAYTPFGKVEFEPTVKTTIEQLTKLMNELSELDASLIVVLPSDLYDILSDEIKNALGNYVINVDLSDEEFLKAIIREYSGCDISEVTLHELASEVLKFDEGHALIARLIGEELRRSKCGTKDVDELLNKAGGNASAFMIHYVNMLLRISNERVKAFSRLLPIRTWIAQSELIGPGKYIMPSGLVGKWLEWEGVYRQEVYPQSEELKYVVSHWLAQKHHSLIERALDLIARVATSQVRLDEVPEGLREALRPWQLHGEKIPENEIVVLLRDFMEKYGKDIERELNAECWRRMALMVGAITSGRAFKGIVTAVEGSARKGEDLFDGLIEAGKPCSIDDLLLEGDELPPFSSRLLTHSRGVYRAYADKWMDVAKELEGLRNKWRDRGSYYNIEAIYALGLSILLATAKEAGRTVDSEAVEAALWLSNFSIQHVIRPSVVDYAIGLLSPLRDINANAWASLLSSAAGVSVTNRVREELDNIYQKIQQSGEDWVKASMAEAYARAEDADKACTLMNEVKEEVLKAITKAYVYHRVSTTGMRCPNVDLYKELEEVNQRLEEFIKSNPDELLNNYRELAKYLEWRSVEPSSEVLVHILKEARGFAIHGLATYALDEGRLDDAVNYIKDEVKISCELSDWTNYLRDKGHVIRATALKGEDVNRIIEDFGSLWEEALESMVPNALYLESMARVLGNYSVSLALAGRVNEVEELINKYGLLLDLDDTLSVGTLLTLRFLGVNVNVPSNAEVLEAVRNDVVSEFLPALKEILGIHVEDVTEECAKYLYSGSCINAYMAVKGNNVVEMKVRKIIISGLNSIGAPHDLLERVKRVDVRGLIEVFAPKNSRGQFILLLRALVGGDKDLARLHAEVGHALVMGKLPKSLFGELADALRSNDERAVRLAVAKLYYLQF